MVWVANAWWLSGTGWWSGKWWVCSHNSWRTFYRKSSKIKQSRECREFLRKYNTKIRGAVTGYQWQRLVVLRRKMKKIIYTFLDLLTIAFLIGGYVFQYFTRKKLGMLRWVNYQNMQIQKNPVYAILKYITVAAAIVLIVLIIVGYRKKKEWKIKNCGYLSEWSFWFWY